MNCLVSILIVFTLSVPLWPEPTWAKGDVVTRDTDNDGRIDQIACFDEGGKIIKLEIDSNSDGDMDRFQYYKNEQVIRIETDSNHDRKIDL